MTSLILLTRRQAEVAFDAIEEALWLEGDLPSKYRDVNKIKILERIRKKILESMDTEE